MTRLISNLNKDPVALGATATEERADSALDALPKNFSATANGGDEITC